MKTKDLFNEKIGVIVEKQKLDNEELLLIIGGHSSIKEEHPTLSPWYSNYNILCHCGIQQPED